MKVPVILPQQQDIKTLLKQINTKDKVSKDVRIQACHELYRGLTCSDYDINDIKNDKKDILGELAAVIHPKYGSLEVKKWCGRIAGMIGASLVDEFDEFVKWTETQLKCARPVAEEEQAIFVSALHYALVELKSKRIRLSDHFATSVLRILAEFLDFSNSHLVFFPILDVCREMAEEYPHVFENFFEEIIDYLVGWDLETSMPSSVPKKCHEVIKSLLPFWHKMPDFGHQMMSQFLDDIGGYVEEYEKHGGLRNCINKACSVLELLVVLIEIYVQDRSCIQQFYWDVVQQSLTSCSSSMAKLGSEPSFRVGVFLSEYCGIFSTAVPIVDAQNVHIVSRCATTAVEIMHKFRYNEAAVINCIKYFTTMFTVPSLPAEFTVPLIERLGILENSVFQLSVCGSHDYFLSNSEWLVQSNSPSCMFAKEQLLAIERLLNSHIQWEQTKAMCVKWLHGLLSGIDDSVMTTLSYRPEFVRIRWAILNAIKCGCNAFECALRHGQPECGSYDEICDAEGASLGIDITDDNLEYSFVLSVKLSTSTILAPRSFAEICGENRWMQQRSSYLVQY
ncbi:unnamed protein product [Haemonchus placei]|uniref:Non-specific serine/threonine protein kinase n=1 Tax=Haemonchus placei TaxID=6290 RepID=A0A0N4X4G2_HAEPC|nr:unnamed protein product [Haemonchus placei]